jgi:hypothetical protein
MHTVRSFANDCDNENDNNNNDNKRVDDLQFLLLQPYRLWQICFHVLVTAQIDFF